MPRLVNTWWNDLDRDPSDDGLRFALMYYGVNMSPRCHPVQSLAVHYDKFREGCAEEFQLYDDSGPRQPPPPPCLLR
jgi:hypothetical protein